MCPPPTTRLLLYVPCSIRNGFSIALIVSLVAWRPGDKPVPPSPLSPIDSTILKSLKWRNVGPDIGGRSIAIAGVRGQPKVGYFGAAGGGLWKTTDGGAHWANVTDGQIHSSSVGAVAVSETDPNIIYLGMGEGEIRGDIQPGDGLYKSIDAGKTWTHIGFENSDAISHIRISPTNPNVVFISDFGKFGVNSEERGIFKSTDGGKSWRKVLYKTPNAGGVDVEIDRTNPNVMYAALWEAYRKEWTMSSGGPNSGMYKSTDAGETWTEITHATGLPTGIDGKIGISVSAVDPNRVFALVENANGGLFRSDDAGATWTLVNNERRFRQRAFYYTHVFADTKDKDLVYVQNVGTYRSTDGGKTFEQRNSRAATRTTCGSIRTTTITSCTRPTRAATSPSTRAPTYRRGRPSTIRRASSTTSWPRRTFRSTCAARSRTRAKSASRARHRLAAGAAVAETRQSRSSAPADRRTATSRPIRATPTSSTPARTQMAADSSRS